MLIFIVRAVEKKLLLYNAKYKNKKNHLREYVCIVSNFRR